MNILLRRRMMSFGGPGPSPQPTPILPEGYTPCELIYTDGYSSFIDSGFTPSATMSYKMDVTVVWEQGNSSMCVPFGYILDGHRYAPFVLEGQYTEVNYDYWYYTSNNQFPKIITLKCDIVISQTGVSTECYYPDGTLYKSISYTYNETDYTPDKTFALLGRKNSATTVADGYFRGGLGRLECYSDDHFGTLVADFIPCYYNGYFGFYEAVSGVFKYNTGNILGFGSAWNTEGFLPNVRNDQGATGYLSPNRTSVASAMYEIPAGCTQIRFNGGTVDTSGGLRPLMFFDSNKTYRDYFYYNSADRVVTVPSNSAYVRLTMLQSTIDTCYIYDVTHGKYIWKGINAAIPIT